MLVISTPPHVRVCLYACVLCPHTSILPVEYGAALFTVFILSETVQENVFFKASFLLKALDRFLV